jgi:hypothetical protein
MKRQLCVIVMFGLLTACSSPGQHNSGQGSPSHVGIKEIGSFHVGGRQVTLSGLPEKEIVFSPGSPPFKVNPNRDFEVEQMYVQYVLLHEPYVRDSLRYSRSRQCRSVGPERYSAFVYLGRLLGSGGIVAKNHP